MRDDKKDDAANKRKKDVFTFQVNTNLSTTLNPPLTTTNASNIMTFPTETAYQGSLLSPFLRDKEGEDEIGNT